MCGIAGVIGHAQAAEWVGRMNAAQTHRGPDGQGVETLRADAAFGHRRLAIVDLSDRGTQPMTSADGRWTITFNGELFNYRELRDELREVRWRSQSDTEVFVEGVAAWGLESTLERAVGMFAVGLWDHREQTLLMARDRLGEKPLVYFWNGPTLAFASEMKALTGIHSAEIRPEALDAYLGLGYVPAPLGIFRGTFKLPAGHWASFRDGELNVRRWWFPERAETQCPRDAGRRQAELRERLGEAVGIRLRADVPVAVALSGGVDSSVVAAEACRGGVKPSAFTVVFDGDESEVPYARITAQRFGLKHTVVHADSGPERLLDGMMRQFDEPFADSSAMGCLALAEAIRGQYKVILDGDGGDEVFGGYRHYEHIEAKQAVKTVAASVGLCDGFRSDTVYAQSKATFRAGERARLLNGHGAQGLEAVLTGDPYLRVPRKGALRKALWHDLHLGLANGLTHKMDMALSGYGIEGRAPLLDHRLVEWAQGLTEHDLVQGREKKVCLRRAYETEVPSGVLDRSKRGFGGPVAKWLEGPLREVAEAMLPCPLLERVPQRDLHGQRQWTLLSLACWAKRWRATW